MDHDDRFLVEQFAAGRDQASFERLYDRHTPMLYALALRLTGSSSGAEELVQESWVRGVERLEGFRWQSSFRTWLTGVLINCNRERRRRQRRVVSIDAPPSRMPETRVASPSAAGRRLDLERAVAALPDGYREVVILALVNGLTHREIGGILGIDEGTSKSQLSRGRAHLRRSLADRSRRQPTGN